MAAVASGPLSAIPLIAQAMPLRIIVRMSVIFPFTIAPAIVPIMPPPKVTSWRAAPARLAPAPDWVAG